MAAAQLFLESAPRGGINGQSRLFSSGFMRTGRKRFGIIGVLTLGLAFITLFPSNDQSARTASVVTMSGDIESFLNGLPLPGRNTEAFVPPSDVDIAAWRQAVGTLMAQQVQSAAALADPLGYDLIEFTDPERNKTYTVFLERDKERGLGTYILNPAARRWLSIEAPHPLADLNTLPESVVMFLELDAVALLISGVHRCSNSQASPCDGSTSVCGGAAEPYRISDVAHYTRNFFEPAHEEIVRKLPDVVSVSVHGFSWRAGDPDIIISNGTSADLAESLTNRLADQYNRTFDQAGIPLRAGSCNQAGGPTRLCATTNVQGRFVNGSSDICGRGVSTISGRERFVHIEQSCALRQFSRCSRPASVPYRTTVEVFAALFPCSPMQQ